MKQLLLILGIVLAITGNPVSSALPNDDALKSIAKNILAEIKDLKSRILRIEDYSQKAVKERLLEVEDVKTLQLTFFKALENPDGKVTPDCAASIDLGFQKILLSVNEDLLQEAMQNITGDEDFLKQSIQTLKDIKSTLMTSLDKEIASCKSDESNCRLTGEFQKKTEELFRLVDLQRYAIVDFVKNSNYYDSKDLQDIIQKELVAPSLSCLQ